MSNLAQFLGQYSNAGGFELLNNGSIEMAGSSINRAVVINPVTLASLNTTPATIGAYLNIEGFAPVRFSTAFPPSATSGVQMTVPNSVPQQLIDNTVPQGIWQPLVATPSTAPDTQRITYGRATQLSGKSYKASVVVNANCTLIVTADALNFYVYAYNPTTRVLSAPFTYSALSLHTNWGSGNGVHLMGCVVRLFPIDSSNVMMTVNTSNQYFYQGTPAGWGAVVLSVNGSNVVSAGATTQQSKVPVAPSYSYAHYVEFVQLTSTTFAYVLQAATTNVDVGVITTSGTTTTFNTALNWNVGNSSDICDLIVVSPTLLLLSGHKGSYISFVTTFSISGTTVTLGNTVSPFITGDSSGSFATISLFKIDASNYVQVAQDNVGAYTFRSRPFSLTGSTINPGTAQTWAVTGINGANQNPSRDYIVTRTDAYKIRHIIGIGGGGGNPIFTNGTLVIPRVVYGPLVFSVSGTGVLTSANGSNLTEYTGMTWGGNATRQWWTTDGKLYLSPYDGSAIKLATIGSGTITLGADYFVPPSTIGAGSDFPRSSEGFIVTDTFGFGTLKTSSGNRTYPLTVSNRFNVNVTLTVPAYSAEAALTANGSALVVSDQTRCWAGGIANNSVYLLDGCV